MIQYVVGLIIRTVLVDKNVNGFSRTCIINGANTVTVMTDE